MAPTQQCRAFTQKHNGLANRIITDVLISVAFDPNNQPPNVQFFKTRALWDTGATHSVITEATAKSLTLTATGKRLVQHAGGKGDFNTHVVNFYLPNQVAIAGVLVSECPDNDGSFGAIIGMDIIMGGDLSISNHQGQTWVTFRYPSFQGVDYVADFNKAKKAVVGKVGRNDPCPAVPARSIRNVTARLVNPNSLVIDHQGFRKTNFILGNHLVLSRLDSPLINRQ